MPILPHNAGSWHSEDLVPAKTAFAPGEAKEKMARAKSKRKDAGDIGDDELLIRYVALNSYCVVDDHIQVGTLKTGEFRSRYNGWSFARVTGKADAAKKTKEYSAEKNKDGREEHLAKKKEGPYIEKKHGYALVKAKVLRNFRYEGERALCVVASSRVHVFVRQAKKYSEEDAGEIRKELVKILGRVVIPK